MRILIQGVVEQFGFLSVSLFVFFEDEFRHVCGVEVGVSVEAAACGEGFEVEFQLADVFYEVFVEVLVCHRGVERTPPGGLLRS